MNPFVFASNSRQYQSQRYQSEPVDSTSTSSLPSTLRPQVLPLPQLLTLAEWGMGLLGFRLPAFILWMVANSISHQFETMGNHSVCWHLRWGIDSGFLRRVSERREMDIATIHMCPKQRLRQGVKAQPLRVFKPGRSPMNTKPPSQPVKPKPHKNPMGFWTHNCWSVESRAVGNGIHFCTTERA